MQIADSNDDLCGVELNLLLREAFVLLEDLIELTTLDEGHDKVKTQLRLEQVVHAH